MLTAGQGMNCALEDVKVLIGALRQAGAPAGGPHAVQSALAAYSAERQPDASAIAQLSQQNYVEMRHSVSRRSFRFRRMIDAALNRVWPSFWTPL